MNLRLPIIAIALSVFAALPCLAADKLPMGLVKDKPTEGRFVKTDRGYMVPYSFQMPGGEGVVEMVPIPGGEYMMGSPAGENGRSKDEGPQVRVRIEPFWMGKYEVTWIEYKQFMGLYEHFKAFETLRQRKVTDSNRIDAITAPTELYDPSFTFDLGEEDRQPASTMTQYAAKQYTKWMTAITGTQFRLPSEAEWEYACRAGADTAYHFGDDPAKLGDYAWFHGNSDATTHLVGEKKPNAWGLYDMHGNVGEWVLDEYDASGYKMLTGKKGLTGVTSIKWPTKVYPRTVRGGSWADTASRCRAAVRMGSHDEDWKSEDPNIPLSPWWFTSDPSRGVGFRLFRPVNELPRKQMVKYWEIDVEDLRDDVDARLDEGRGALGIVDPSLPAAIKKLDDQ